MNSQRRFLIAVSMLMVGLAVPAFAVIGQITVNTVTYDSRDFEIGGHISYTFQTLGSSKVLNIPSHNNTNCGSGQCGSSPEFLMKRRIVSGSTSYNHELGAKIIKNGTSSVEGPQEHYCDHSGSGWLYTTSYFSNDPYWGTLTDTWAFKVVWVNNVGVDRDSASVDLN